LIIAVNTRLLLPNKLEGIGWFMYETIKRIAIQHPEHEFVFIFDRPYSPEFIFSSNVTPVVIGPPARHPFLFYAWFEYSVPYILKKHKCNLFISPDGYLSLNTRVKQLAVIHDLSYIHHPKDVKWLMQKYFNYFFPRFAHKAARIATVSEYSKRDINKHYTTPLHKIDVVYNGVNENFKPLPLVQQATVRGKYSNGCEYFVYVGALHPRKNIARLLQAYDAFATKSKSNVKLIIVGEKHWWNNHLKKVFALMQHKHNVVFTGRLSTTELNNVLASALALTYIPYFEGFGIPILEGFKCQVPVITSNTTSMPEVAGDAALLVNPFEVHNIVDAMLAIYTNNNNLRATLINKGLERLHYFNWQKSADLLWNSITKCMAEE
jgi:glycosyltransferase involved in cell wall biosynthesis